MNFQPLYDMVLVKPDQVADKIGSIFVPQGSIQGPDKPGDYHDTAFGTVVAIGPGDKHKPFALLRCGVCHQLPQYVPKWDHLECACGKATPAEDANAWDQGRHPMLTQVGDRVVFPRRPSSPGGEFSLQIDGETYMMFHEQQFAFAVIDPN